MNRRKLLMSILTGLCICLAGATFLTACKDEHTHSYTQQITTEATCTTKGVMTYTCSCNDTYTEEIPATGVHTWDNGEETKATTCTKEGVTTFTCMVCKTATKTESIDKLPHEHAEKWTSNETHHWHECECGDKKDETKHTAGAPATATTPQTCTVCGYALQVETGILFNTLTVEGAKVYGKVSNTTTEFSFIDEVTVKGNATYVVDNDKDCGSPIYSKTVDLVIGDNTFYVLEMIGNDVKLFTVTIRRRPMYDVSFNVNGGTSVAKQVIEEDFLATEPETTRTGYTFTGWDYDFTQPITQNTEITASWATNKDTKYKVNYYLQNLDNNEYSLYESDELEDETDTTVTAEIKPFMHFTFNDGYVENKLSGNIDGEGALVLRVYYTRNTYMLYVDDSSVGAITNAGVHKYGKEIISTATPIILGYEFIGWYNDEKLLSNNLTYTFIAMQNVTAKFEVKEELSNFEFISDTTSCSITGIKDKTVTNIVVPDYVTSIGYGVFNGCSSLIEIRLPFVGAKAGVTGSGTNNYTFGYIFGGSNYTGAIKATQEHLEKYSDGDRMGRYTYYIPASLKSVTIAGGYIPYHAFEECYNLTSVTIGNNVTGIGEGAFLACHGLTSVYITDMVVWCNISFYGASSNPLSYAKNLYLNGKLVTELVIPEDVAKINSYAFYNCDSLTNVTIQNSVISIDNYAFYDCSNLMHVGIGDEVTSIGDYVFRDCDNLTSVIIGEHVTKIGNYVFRDCGRLASVYYKGAEKDWSKISIGSYDSNFTNATRYYYSETKPNSSGKYWHYVDGLPTKW